MATHHAEPGEVVDLATWSDELAVDKSKVIAKVAHLELARLVIKSGEEMHSSGYCRVPGPVVIHCLEGELELCTPKTSRLVRRGQLVYLLGQTDHSLRGVQDAVVLLTIVLGPA